MSNIKHYESLSIIMDDFDIWSGQTRLAAQDFKLGVGGEIPPEKLAQLGSKKICDPAMLRGFHRLKTQTDRLLMRYGMKFMNGYAVPIAKTNEICAKLDDISKEYEQLKQEFIKNYYTAIDSWVQENPGYEKVIRDGALPVEQIEKRIGFQYQVAMIQPIASNDTLTQSLNRKVESLGDDLITEVTETATKFYNERFVGQQRVRTSTRQTLINLRDKIDGLSFLNGSLVPLVTLLDDTIAGYAKNAIGHNIEAPFFYQVMAVVSILSHREHIEQYANGHMLVDTLANDLNSKAVPGVGISQSAVADALAHELRMQTGDDGGDNAHSDNQGLFQAPSVNEDDSPSGFARPVVGSDIDEQLADIDLFFSQQQPASSAPISPTAPTAQPLAAVAQAKEEQEQRSVPPSNALVAMPLPSFEAEQTAYF